MKEITISTSYIKLDQFLKYVGLCQTGGQSKLIIKDGLIKVNGEITKQRGKKIKKGDIVEVSSQGKYIVI